MYIYISVENILWFFLFPLQIRIMFNRSIYVLPLIDKGENGHSRGSYSEEIVFMMMVCVMLSCDWSYLLCACSRLD